jgi:uncharacterized protein involved in exopolysaccharide biosynthesis
MNENEFDPLALWTRHRGKALIAMLLVLAITLLITAFSEKEYESLAKLQVQIGRESVALDPTATIGPFVGIADTREMEIQAIQELILSRKVLGKVVEKIGINEIIGAPKPWATTPANAKWVDDYNLNPLRVYDRQAKAIKKLQLDLDLDIPRNSKIISLSYKSDDPEKAHRVLQTLIDVTIDEHLQVNRNDESRRFFEAEAERLHEKVMEYERALAREKSATGISSIDQQRRLLLEQIGKYQDEVAHVKARKFSLGKEIEVRAKQLEQLVKTETKSQVVGSANNPEFEMQLEVFKLELREKELAAKYDDSNDQLQQAREQLKLAKEALQKNAQTRQITEGVNEERSRYELAMFEKQAELAENETRFEYLLKDLADVRAQLVVLDNEASRVNDLERELQLADSAYKKYKESLEIARIEQQRLAERISNIRSLQPPTYSEQPISPRGIVNLLLGLVVGGFAGIGTAFFAEQSIMRFP